MDNQQQEKINTLFNNLCDLAIRISSEKNTTGKNLPELPAVIDRILQLRPFVR